MIDSGPSRLPAAAREREIARVVATVRRRWRMRRALEGLLVATAVTLAAALVAMLTMDAHRFDPAVVSSARIVVWALAAALVAALVVPAIRRRIADRDVALYLEAHAPALDALVLSAVEADAAGPDVSAGLRERLLERAAAACRRLGDGRAPERARLRRRSGALAALLGFAAAAVLLGPPALRHAAGLLVSPWRDAVVGSPYRIEVQPGSVSVLSGDDQAVRARTVGFDAARLDLVHRSVGEAGWARTAAVADGGGEEHAALLLNVERPIEYYVEADGVRSATFRIDVTPLPRVKRIDLVYHFPARSRRPPETVVGGGDIAAVRGTRVEIRVLPEAPASAGELVLGGEERLALERDGEALVGTLAVETDGYYRVDLAATNDRMVPVSPEHAVIALADGAPKVTVARPGRDTRVTRIEEIEIEVSAEDDVSVHALELVLSVNGGEPESVPIGAGAGPAPILGGTHTLFLEDRPLEPGDLVVYHAQARDGEGAGSHETITDLYFMEVRPFDRDYRRGSAQGGGARAGQRFEGTLAAQQRDLVVALFRLVRDRAALEETESAERFETIRGAQARIRDRVDAIARRLGARPVVELTPGYRQMAAELPRASAAMLRVEALLGVRDADEALAPAREALRHLQRADAAFREVQVAQGGGGNNASANDLANLFRLELDKFRSPYADVQRGQWDPRAAAEKLDETLRRLKELARRQQREAERMARRSARSDLAGRDAPTQAALAAEVEALTRELERLTRERPNESLASAIGELERAARAMREAGRGQGRDGDPSRGDASQGGASPGDGSRGDASRAEGSQGGARRGEGYQGGARRADASQGGASRGDGSRGSASGADGSEGGAGRADASRAALERLRAARRALDQTRPTGLALGLADALERAEALEREQEEIMRALDGKPGEEVPDAPGIVRRKARMIADVNVLRSKLDRLAESARAVEPGVARSLRGASGLVRDDTLGERISRSRDAVVAGAGEIDRALESAIARTLQGLRERLASAAGEIGQSDTRARARAMEDLRALMRSLSGMRDRAGGPGAAGGPAVAGDPGAVGGRDGWAAGGGSAVFDPADLELIRRSLGEHRRDLEEVRDVVEPSGSVARDIEAVIERIAALDGDAGLVDPGTIARSPAELLALLQAVERALREQEGADEPPSLVTPRATDLPVELRALVDEYYRRLSDPARRAAN